MTVSRVSAISSVYYKCLILPLRGLEQIFPISHFFTVRTPHTKQLHPDSSFGWQGCVQCWCCHHSRCVVSGWEPGEDDWIHYFSWIHREGDVLCNNGPRLILIFCETYSIPANSHACGLKTSISRRLTLAGQFLTPDWKMWVVAVLFDTISKNMLTQTHVRNENHV